MLQATYFLMQVSSDWLFPPDEKSVEYLILISKALNSLLKLEIDVDLQ
jgi:homoserine acetyltransferase